MGLHNRRGINPLPTLLLDVTLPLGAGDAPQVPSATLKTQYCPHIEQTLSVEGLDSLKLWAFSLSMQVANCPSQSRFLLIWDMVLSHSQADFIPLAISAAWAAILEAMTPSQTS